MVMAVRAVPRSQSHSGASRERLSRFLRLLRQRIRLHASQVAAAIRSNHNAGVAEAQAMATSPTRDGAAPGEVARQPEETAPERTLAAAPWGQVWGQVAGPHNPRGAATRLLERVPAMGRGGFEPPTDGL